MLSSSFRLIRKYYCYTPVFFWIFSNHIDSIYMHWYMDNMRSEIWLLGLLCSSAHSLNVGLTMNTKWNSTTFAVAHHIYFLYDTLERSETWEPTLLMESDVHDVHIYGKTYRTKNIWDVATMDVVIEGCATYPDNRLKQRHPHIKFVHFNQGPFYFESLSGVRNNKEIAMTTQRRFDAIWVTPQYKWQAPYISEWSRTDDWAVTPYLWSPRRLATVNNYQTGTANRVGVYETNRGVYKMSMVPIMIANRAFRKGANITHFETRAVRRIWTDYFRTILDDMDINIDASPDLVHIPQHYADKRIGTVLSHHLNNGLNYLYLEALYMNMSLVHNSEYIKDCGYYYPEFDIEEGARVLQHAITTHDTHLETYAKASAKCLWRYAPENPVNLKVYENLLEDLF